MEKEKEKETNGNEFCNKIQVNVTRTPAAKPCFHNWKYTDPKWEEMGIKWIENKEAYTLTPFPLPDGFRIEQTDNGPGGSNTFWCVYDKNGKQRARINSKDSSHEGYHFVHFF